MHESQRGSKARLPGSRELFWLIRINGVHPILWSRGRFVVSGFGFSLFLSLLSVNCLFMAFFVLKNPNSMMSLIKKSSNPIRADIDAFMALLASVSHVVASGHIVFFLRRRKQLARVFNELNSLWLMVGKPRQRWAYSAFVYLPWSISVYSCTMYSGFNTASVASESFIFQVAASIHTIFYYMTVTHLYSVICVVMLYVYGVLNTCLDRILDSPSSLRWKQSMAPVKPSEKGIVTHLNTILTAFSIVLSPLLMSSFLAYVCIVMQIIYRDVMQTSHRANLGIWFIPAGFGCFLAALVYFSNVLAEKRKDEIPERLFKELDTVLKGLPHPPKASQYFELNLGILVSLAGFFMNHVMVFIQFKAVVLGTNTTATNTNI